MYIYAHSYYYFHILTWKYLLKLGKSVNSVTATVIKVKTSRSLSSLDAKHTEANRPTL